MTSSQHMTDSLERITGSTDLGLVTENSDLIIEAIIEDMNVKLPFFKELGQFNRIVVHCMMPRRGKGRRVWGWGGGEE